MNNQSARDSVEEGAEKKESFSILSVEEEKGAGMLLLLREKEEVGRVEETGVE